MEIWETGNSDKGAGVTICDLMAQLEGHDSKIKSRRGYSIGRLEVYEVLTENWEMVQRYPEHLRRQARRT